MKYMYSVDLPGLDWFSNGNVFSGSLGTDPYRGCLNTTTLNYRVYIGKVGGEKFFLAFCWLIPPWNAPKAMDEINAARFEASEVGRVLAENWIKSKIIGQKASENLLLREPILLLPEAKGKER